MNTMKKDFQKVIGKIRKELGAGEYPKAMMTAQQQAKNTATVNCWGSKERADAVIKHPLFTDFLKRYGAIAQLEQKDEGWSYPIHHIRIRYLPEWQREMTGAELLGAGYFQACEDPEWLAFKFKMALDPGGFAVVFASNPSDQFYAAKGAKS